MKNKAKVFLIDDDDLIIAVLTRTLKKEGYDIYSETETDGIMEKIATVMPDVVLLDISMPGRSGLDILREILERAMSPQVIMLTADDSAETAVKAMKLGAADYITKPFNGEEVKIILHNILEKESLKQEVNYLRKAYSEVVEREIVGESAPIRELIDKTEKMAQAGVTAILITGESGTGKEIVARHIHNRMYGEGAGRQAPFVSINCAAVPETLLESELFGFEKGSFTDAKSSQKGLFAQARRGTILLDEISEMKTDLQAKLLRVLEERVIRPIGGVREIPVEVTVIATSNVNLAEAVQKGRFRNDLFFRLSTFYLHIVPLRERKEDIPLLSKHFLQHFKKKYNKKKIKGFSAEAEEILKAYRWQGNVRELKNLVERFVVLENSEVIELRHLPQWILMPSEPLKESGKYLFNLPESGLSLEDLQRDLIIQALDRTDHNMTLAAKLLDVTYDSFRYQLKKFGIK